MASTQARISSSSCTSAMRTCPSPEGPNAAPGVTSTPALVNLPADTVQPVHKHVAAMLVGKARRGDAVLRAGQRRNGGFLYRQKHTVVEVQFQRFQLCDHIFIPEGKADTRAREAVCFGERVNLDATFFAPSYRRKLPHETPSNTSSL